MAESRKIRARWPQIDRRGKRFPSPLAGLKATSRALRGGSAAASPQTFHNWVPGSPYPPSKPLIAQFTRVSSLHVKMDGTKRLRLRFFLASVSNCVNLTCPQPDYIIGRNRWRKGFPIWRLLNGSLTATSALLKRFIPGTAIGRLSFSSDLRQTELPRRILRTMFSWRSGGAQAASRPGLRWQPGFCRLQGTRLWMRGANEGALPSTTCRRAPNRHRK